MLVSNPLERTLSAPLARGAGWPSCAASRLPRGTTSPRSDDLGNRPWRWGNSEDGGPVGLHADHGPGLASRPVQHLLGTGGVAELPVRVVVEDEQAQTRQPGLLREVEHRS